MGGLTCVLAASGLWAASGTVASAKEVLRGVSVRERVVALSFDDGPDPRWTPRVLSLLGRFHDTATFFVTGENAAAHPALIRREIAQGDQVGDHTYSHPHLERLPALVVQTQIERAARAIERAGAPPPTLFRPPFGQLDATVSRTARRDGLELVLWSVCVERRVDHGPIPAEVASILSLIRPGSIILAHDGGEPDRSRTLAALPLLLRGLRAHGYKAVTIGRLLTLSRRRAARKPAALPAVHFASCCLPSAAGSRARPDPLGSVGMGTRMRLLRFA